MKNLIKNVNEKISKSTIQVQNMMSTLLCPSQPLQSPYRNRSKNNNKNQQNPQENNTKQESNADPQRSKINNHDNWRESGYKNSCAETSSSNKFYESKDKFNSTTAATNIYKQFQESYKISNNYSNEKLKDNHRGISLNQINHKKNLKQRNQISCDTKFAIGQNLYPTSVTTMLLKNLQNISKQNITQVKNNYKHKALSVLQLDHDYVMNYVLERKQLSENSKPQQIFQYFYEFAQYFKRPLIKKYKNCLYFGQSLQNLRTNSMKYVGFLYFFNKKLYYGQFQQQSKQGLGVQINIQSRIIYKGTFNKGHKIGKFQVYSKNNQTKYQGYLSKGKYHGIGKLQTPISVYNGCFFQGMRNGQGQQYFYKSGLRLKGIFQMDKFSNKLQKSQELPKRNVIKQQIKVNMKHIPKFSNVFQFSFHDESSQDENYQNQSPKNNFIIKKLISYRKLITKPKLSHNQANNMQSASDDDPLPSPFRRISYKK